MMDSDFFAQKVFKHRRARGMSQGKLADLADISRNYVSLIERGEAQNVSMKIINQIALALGVTSAELTGDHQETATLIPPSLREFGLQAGLQFDAVDRLSRIPRRGQEPQTPEEWKALYEAVRPYLE